MENDKEEKFKKIKIEFSDLLKNSQSGRISLSPTKEQYKTLLEKLRYLALENKRPVLSLDDLEINNQTSYQEFNLKLENVINVIDNQFLGEMADFAK